MSFDSLFWTLGPTEWGIHIGRAESRHKHCHPSPVAVRRGGGGHGCRYWGGLSEEKVFLVVVTWGARLIQEYGSYRDIGPHL